jgi:hypothetical protein
MSPFCRRIESKPNRSASLALLLLGFDGPELDVVAYPPTYPAPPVALACTTEGPYAEDPESGYGFCMGVGLLLNGELGVCPGWIGEWGLPRP